MTKASRLRHSRRQAARMSPVIDGSGTAEHLAVRPRVLGDPDDAPPPRTLLDVFAASVAAHPDAPAVDDGRTAMSYSELAGAAEALADRLAAAGVGRGDRVGVRLPSGTCALYVAILGVLAAGRRVRAGRRRRPRRARRARLRRGRRDGGPGCAISNLPRVDGVLRPSDRSSATTRGSSSPRGRPGRRKGVAVSHRSAAAFVDAEARLFLVRTRRSARATGCSPASRWRSTRRAKRCGWPGATAPAWCPRRARWCAAGSTSAPWLVDQRITVVSTVPTLAALWPHDCLDGVRLLIFGGEACPPELAERLVEDGREVWNTYGPTEATVVACAAPLTEDGPVRIGLPLDGWELAVVDQDRRPVDVGEIGELIIGGVGLARYLDPAKDAEKFAADARARLAAGLPQRRPRAVRPGRPAVRRPRRRAGQARRAADRARRGRRARCRRCRMWRRGRRSSPDHAGRATRSWSATSCRPATTVRPDAAAAHGCARRCPRRWCPSLAVVDDAADPDVGQGRPRRAAVAAAVGAADAPAARPDRHRRLAGRPVDRDPRRGGHRAGRRLLRPRRRQPVRRAAGLGAAHAVTRR